ncbi:MAG: hypothetical protein LBI77_01200 [Puniceicoccales bacterium]|jgi:hypothetical protein|nr:hypothetical protein [Puniceicoccales bacterium]
MSMPTDINNPNHIDRQAIEIFSNERISCVIGEDIEKNFEDLTESERDKLIKSFMQLQNDSDVRSVRGVTGTTTLMISKNRAASLEFFCQIKITDQRELVQFEIRKLDIVE